MMNSLQTLRDTSTKFAAGYGPFFVRLVIASVELNDLGERVVVKVTWLFIRESLLSRTEVAS